MSEANVSKPRNPAAWLTTPRLSLRPPTPSSLDRIFEIHSDPETYRHLPQSAMTHIDQGAERLAQWIEHWSAYDFGYADVLVGDDVIGFAGVTHHTLLDRPILNLYYRFHPAFWGHGYATEAASAVLAWAREHHPATPVVARIATNNLSSISLAERVGLVRQSATDPTDPVEHHLFASRPLA